MSIAAVITLPDALIKNSNEDKFERRLTEEVSKLDKSISENKADIIKWMFIFWAGQIGILVAVLDIFFKR